MNSSWPVWPTRRRIWSVGLSPGTPPPHGRARAGARPRRRAHAGGVHAPLDDALDDLDVADGGRPVAARHDPVLDLEPALEVEAELRLDRAHRGVRREPGQRQVGPEVDDESVHSADGDE